MASTIPEMLHIDSAVHSTRPSISEEHVGSSTEGSNNVQDVEKHGKEVDSPEAPEKMNFKTKMCIVSLGGLLTASQIPLYLVGGDILRLY